MPTREYFILKISRTWNLPHLREWKEELVTTDFDVAQEKFKNFRSRNYACQVIKCSVVEFYGGPC